MINWNDRVQEWMSYEKRLEYRDVPINRLQGVTWEQDGVYLLLSDNKRARISTEALYELFILCQRQQWSNRVRVAIHADAFKGTQVSYRNLIRDVLMALWKHEENNYSKTNLRKNSPRALFERKDGKVTIVGIAPPRFALVSAPGILQSCNPEKADWKYWGEGMWAYKDVVPSEAYEFSWSGWEDRELSLAHHVSYWLLERNGVFVRFFCGYTGKIGTGAHVGVLIDGRRVSITSLGNVIVTESGGFSDWKTSRVTQTLKIAWKLCFYGPFLDVVAQMGRVISTEPINNNIKQGIVKGIKDKIKSLEKDMGVSFGSPSLEKASDASTFGEFVTTVGDELAKGSDEIGRIYAEEILGEFIMRVISDREAAERTGINRWRYFAWALMSAL